MSTLRMPTPLRSYVEGQKELEIAAPTVRLALQELSGRYPQLKRHLFDDEDQLRPYVNLFLNGQDVRSLQGPDTPLGDHDILMIVPSIAGGLTGD
jgi:molybdopterin converting factor small subunit